MVIKFLSRPLIANEQRADIKLESNITEKHPRIKSIVVVMPIWGKSESQTEGNTVKPPISF